jgi:hypothetical protein
MATVEKKPTIFLRNVSVVETYAKMASGDYAKKIKRGKLNIIEEKSLFTNNTKPSFLDKNGNKIYLNGVTSTRTELCDECKKSIPEKVYQTSQSGEPKVYQIPVMHERHFVTENGRAQTIHVFHVGGGFYCSKACTSNAIKQKLSKDIYGVYTNSERYFSVMCDMMDETDGGEIRSTPPRVKLLPFTLEYMEM